MDLIELIKKRKSIRQFRLEQPPKEVILECLEAASWAPNPTNQQPWKFIVLTGNKLKKVIAVIEESYAEAFQKREQLSSPEVNSEMTKILSERKESTFQQLITFIKEKGMDIQAVGRGNFNFHSAPMGIIFATYSSKDQNFFKSTVAAMENFLLAATEKGLGTCWMNAVSICQDYIKTSLNLPSELILVDGVAVGYPTEDAPLNHLPRERLPITELIDWS